MFFQFHLDILNISYYQWFYVSEFKLIILERNNSIILYSLTRGTQFHMLSTVLIIKYFMIDFMIKICESDDLKIVQQILF